MFGHFSTFCTKGLNISGEHSWQRYKDTTPLRMFRNFGNCKNSNFFQNAHPSRHLAVQSFNKSITKTRCEICSKLTIKTPERHQWRRFGVFIVNIEHISLLVLLFLLLVWVGKCRLGQQVGWFWDFSTIAYLTESGKV